MLFILFLVFSGKKTTGNGLVEVDLVQPILLKE
jgi:hypothetical protein